MARTNFPAAQGRTSTRMCATSLDNQCREGMPSSPLNMQGLCSLST